MKKTIIDFPKQFEFEPVIENADKLKKADSFVVLGMGGSNLTSSLLTIADPYLDLFCHRDYGLPKIKEERLKNSLIIASSYSGNTEETLDGFREAVSRSRTSGFRSGG